MTLPLWLKVSRMRSRRSIGNNSKSGTALLCTIERGITALCAFSQGFSGFFEMMLVRAWMYRFSREMLGKSLPLREIRADKWTEWT